MLARWHPPNYSEKNLQSRELESFPEIEGSDTRIESTGVPPLSKTQSKSSRHFYYPTREKDQWLDILSISVTGDGGIQVHPTRIGRLNWNYTRQFRTLGPAGIIGKCTMPVQQTNTEIKLHYHRSGMIAIRPVSGNTAVDSQQRVTAYGTPIPDGETRQIFSYSLLDASLLDKVAMNSMKKYSFLLSPRHENLPRDLTVAGVLHTGKRYFEAVDKLQAYENGRFYIDAYGEMIPAIPLDTLECPAVLTIRAASDSLPCDRRLAAATLIGLSSSGLESLEHTVSAWAGPGNPCGAIMTKNQVDREFAIEACLERGSFKPVIR